MPTYTYTCTACNDVIEKRQSFSDAPLTTCEQCGGTLRKVIHPVGIVFKGSGWYITDSRSSTAALAGNGARSGRTEASGETAAKKTESSSTSTSDKSSTTTSDKASSGD